MSRICKLSNILEELNQMLLQSVQCDQKTRVELAQSCKIISVVLNREIKEQSLRCCDTQEEISRAHLEWKLRSTLQEIIDKDESEDDISDYDISDHPEWWKALSDPEKRQQLDEELFWYSVGFS